MHSISSAHKLLRTSLKKYRPFFITEVCAFSPSSIHTISRPQMCKYFSQTYISHNLFIINALQNSRFRNAKSKLPFFVGIIFTKPKQFYIYSFKYF